MKAFLAAVVLVAMATSGSCAKSNINCYTCGGSNTHIKAGTWAYVGCVYPFNTTQIDTVSCPGQCVTSVSFNPTSALAVADIWVPAFIAGNQGGSFDTIVRGCTVTAPPVGCFTGRDPAKPHTTTCVSVCSSDLCNSADGLRMTTVGLAVVGLASLIVSAFRRY